MARTTVDNTIERIRRQLSSSLRYEVNALGGLITETTNVIAFTYDFTDAMRPGALLSIGTELLRVMQVDSSAKEAVVIRGWQDTDAAVHPLATEVWINPRFTGADIYEAMVDEINAWPPDLYRVASAESSVGVSTSILTLADADALGVIDIRYQGNGLYDDLGQSVNTWPAVDFRLIRTAGAPQVRIIGGLDLGLVRITVARPFAVELMSPDADLVADVGLAPSMLDVLAFGVKARLMGDANHGRSQRGNADEPRRAQDVPVNAALQDAQTVFALYLRRRSEEMNRLRTKYPVRM